MLGSEEITIAIVNIYWSICSPYMHLAHLIPITTLFFYRWATCCLESLSKDCKVPKLAASILVQAVWPRGWAVNQSAQVFKVNMFLRRMSWKKKSPAQEEENLSSAPSSTPCSESLSKLLSSLLWVWNKRAGLGDPWSPDLTNYLWSKLGVDPFSSYERAQHNIS